MGVKERMRCHWATGDELMAAYHDDEWGRPEGAPDDNAHFERLVLEMFQAGLSWRLILYRREALRKAFKNFDIDRVARFGLKDIERLMNDASIIRNRMKIEATIENARRIQQLRKEHGSFMNWLKVSLRGLELKEMQKLFKKTFKFMGPSVAESYFQSVGIIDVPHDPECWRYRNK